MSPNELDPQLPETCLSAPWPVLVRPVGGAGLWINRCLARSLGVGCGWLGEDQAARLAGTDHGAVLQWNEPRIAVGAGRIWERTRVALGDGGWEAHYFADVTEHETLRRDLASLQNQVRMLEIRDAETGLLNRHAILHALDAQLSRSRRYGNPLSAVLLRLAPLDGASGSELNLRALSEEFNSRLRWADQIGRLDGSGFLLVLPETRAAEATRLAARLTGQQAGGLLREAGWSAECRSTGWQRGDDVGKLLQRLGESYP